MKKIILLFIIFTLVTSLASCERRYEPTIIKDYELEEVSFEETSNLEWQLNPIDEEYSYVSDYFHDDRDGYFLRIYQGENLVYEELSDEYFYSLEATRINNSIYLYYWKPQDIGDEIYYIVRLDEDFHKEILLQETDYHFESCLFNETCIAYLKTNRTEDFSTLVELNYQGQIINSIDFDQEFTRLFIDNGTYYLKQENQIYSFDFTNGLKLYDELDLTQRSYIKIQNGTISYVTYLYNDTSLEIYYHNGIENKMILNIPEEDEKLAYYCEEAIMAEDDIFIPVSVGSKNMELFAIRYSRMLVFHYDGETQQVKLIFLDKKCDISHVARNKMYIGYPHDGENNGMSDGTFYSFDIKESASKLW